MNPYQDIIDWLRSPDGERWSENRMSEGRRISDAGPVDYARAFAEGETPALIGVFSVKED